MKEGGEEGEDKKEKEGSEGGKEREERTEEWRKGKGEREGENVQMKGEANKTTLS